jgi:hypothetical protein
MRLGRNKTEGERKTKRSRLGKAPDRALYKSCKGPWGPAGRAAYGRLCQKADALHGIRRQTGLSQA